MEGLSEFLSQKLSPQNFEGGDGSDREDIDANEMAELNDQITPLMSPTKIPTGDTQGLNKLSIQRFASSQSVSGGFGGGA